MSKTIKHTILMQEKNGDNKVMYNNVVLVEGVYGCMIRLHMEDGSTATFTKDDWLLFDLTPSLGWNNKAINF